MTCHRYPLGRFLVCFAAVIATGSVGVCERPSDVDSIEHTVLRSRESLRSGHVELDSAVAIAKGRLAGQTLTTHCDIYFDGEMIRGDYREKLSPLGSGKGKQAVARRVSRSFCDGVFLWFGESITQAPALAYIRPPSDSLAQASLVPNPRLIGMCPSDTQSYEFYALNYVCTNTQWTFVDDLGTETYGGVLCRKWKYRKDGALPSEGPKDQNILFIWLDPKRDNSFVGMRRETPDDVQQIECRLNNVEGYGWFPSHVMFTRWEGTEISRREELNVTVHQFNKPIGRDFFQLTGMGVPIGSIVVDSVSDPSGKTLEMQQDGPVQVRKAPGVPRGIETSQRSRFSTTLLVINGLIVGAIALLLLWRKIKS